MKRLATFGVGSSTYLLVVVGRHHHAVGRAHGAAHRVHPNWSPRTVCGREWHIVADADDDGDELVGIPDCRACLRALMPRPSS
jgi:hypothetical protein